VPPALISEGEGDPMSRRSTNSEATEVAIVPPLTRAEAFARITRALAKLASDGDRRAVLASVTALYAGRGDVRPAKRYLDDSVYADWNNGQVVLTTENGLGPSNVIYLEPETIAELERFVADILAHLDAERAKAAVST
jgi:hypothetical protein